MVNLVRMRNGDRIVTIDAGIHIVKECWSAGDVFQLITEDNPEEILTYNISGYCLSKDSKWHLHELIEVPQEGDDEIFYIPKVEVNMWPILHVNGEDKIIIKLMDLDGLVVKKKQTLRATYKPVISALLQKKHGRDIEVIKEERIICESEEDCKERLEKIEKQLSAEKPEDGTSN